MLLESACFLTASVGRTSRRLGLISESSLRFERGVDPNGCAAAADRAAQLLTEVAGGRVAAGTVDVYPSPVSPARSTLRPARLNALLGTAIPTARIAEVLERLGLAVRAGEGEDAALTVEVPTFRPDLEREMDLIEEVVRVDGMGASPRRSRRAADAWAGSPWSSVAASASATALRAAGLNEAMT